MFGLFVGAIVDGRRRLPLMVTTDVVQAVLLMTIPVLWWLDLLSLPALVVIVMATGTASVVNRAATMSFLPRLVEGRQLQPAHARMDGADAVSSSAGPALGGLLVWLVGAPLTLLLPVLTYIYSALALRRIQLPEPPSRTGVTVKSLARETVEGFRWIYRGSGLITLAIANHVWFVGHAILGVVLAPYVLRTLDLDALQFGLVGAAGGVGAVIGATVITRVGRRLGTGRTIIVCRGVTSIGVVTMWLAAQGTTVAAALVVVMAGQGLYGLAMGMSNSHEMSFRQLLTPDELQARTNTTLHSLNRAIVMVVAPVAGMLADAWGNRPMLLVAVATFALLTAGLGVSSFRDVRAPA